MKRIILEHGDIDIIYIFYKKYVAVEHIKHNSGEIVSCYTSKDIDGIMSHLFNDCWALEEGVTAE